MLSYIRHLDLKAGAVARHVCECAPLECLYHHVLYLPAYSSLCPICFADGQAGSKEPWGDQLLIHYYIRLVMDRARRIEEVPEYAGDVVLGLGLEVNHVDPWNQGSGRIVACVAGAVYRVRCFLPCPVGRWVGACLGVRDALDTKVGGSKCVVGIPRHGNARGAIFLVVLFAYLHKARY